MDESPHTIPGQMPTRRIAWALLAAFAIVAAFYVWTTRSNNLSWRFGHEQRDYYNLLVHGFLDGQLNLKVDVPEALLRSSDPYDPAKRPPGVALHDASLYHGKYYIYYGVVPAVVLLLPFRIVTGIDLPLPVAVLGFSLASLAIACVLFESLRRRFFPRCGPVITCLLVIGYGMTCGAPVLLRRSSMYELPIVTGGFFSLAALACLFAFVVRRRGVFWLALAGTCWGLAIGSRPTYLLAPLTLVIAMALRHQTRDTTQRSGRQLFTWTVAAFAPLVVIGLLLAWYNFARFGSPTEFGVSYILSGVYESKIEHFRLRYLPWNVFAYLFAPVDWSSFFPFYHAQPITVTRPYQHYGMDIPFGLLTNVPFYWLAVFAVRALAPRKTAHAAVGLRAFIVLAGVVAIGVLAIVLMFYAAMARYVGDFGPTLAILAVIGGMAVTDRAGGACSAMRRAVACTIVALFVATSAFTITAFSIEAYGRFRAFNGTAYAALARLADAPHYWLSRGGEGALMLEFTLPSASDGRREELLRTGRGEDTDRLFVTYPDTAHVVFEFEHHGAPPVRSDAIVLDRAHRHVLRVAMAPLYPPATWPGWKAHVPDEVARVCRHLEVSVDGRAVIARHQAFHASSPDTLVVGGTGEQAFSGRIVAVSREPLERTFVEVWQTVRQSPVVTLPADGVWTLDVRFVSRPAGTREPLLVTGVTGEADFLAVEYLGERSLRLVFDHWGSQSRFSEPITFTPERDTHIVIRHQGYAAARNEGPKTPTDLVVSVDGHEVWRIPAFLFAIGAGDAYLGENPLGGSSCSAKFSGSIRRQSAPGEAGVR